MKQRHTSTALLPAPSVDEAQDNSLPDTAPKATVVIPAEANLRVDDLLIVTWEGIAGVGTVVSFPLHIGAGDVGNAYNYAVKKTAIAANAGRTVSVSYEVVRADGTGRESSAVYLLNIGTGTGAEFTLDTSPARVAIGATLTRNASGGVPPYTYTSYNTSVVTVDSPAEGIVRGVGAGSASVLVHDSAEPETSQKGYVITVVSGGAHVQGAYGGNSTMKKKNTSKAQLPAPLVEEAEGNALPETAPKATVVVPVEANLRLDDLLIVRWEGVAGAGTVVSFPLHIGAGDVGRVYTYSVKRAAIEANIGHVVNVSYEVTRADGTGREPSAVYLLSIGTSGSIEQSTADFEDAPLGEITDKGITSGNLVVRVFSPTGGRITDVGPNPPFLVSRYFFVEYYPVVEMGLLREAENVTFAFKGTFRPGETGTFTAFDKADEEVARQTLTKTGSVWVDLSAAQGKKIKRIEYSAATQEGAAFDNFTFTY